MARRPVPLTGLFLLALLATLAPTAPSTAAPPTPEPIDDYEWQVADLGPASVATPTGSGHFIDDILWFSTRQASPPSVIGLDPSTGRAISQIPLPAGQGAWVTDVIGTDVYVGTYTPARVYRVDTLTGEVDEVMVAGGSGAVVYAMDVSPDGVLYVGTYASAGGRLLSYDPATETVHDFGTPIPGQDYVRAVVADDQYVYAGIGSTAHLVRLDRATGELADLTPPELDGATFVSSLALHDGAILGGVSPRGQLLVVDAADPSRYELVQATNESFVVAITGGSPSRAYFAARPSGTLYGYDLWSGQTEALTVPAPEKAASGLTFHDGLVWGLVHGLVYAYDPVEETVSGYPLDAAGVQPSPERPMALAADGERVYASGSAGVQIHDVFSGGSERVFVPGESKSMWATADRVFLSVYTRALIYELIAPSGPARLLAEIGHEQTRPRDSHLQTDTGRLLVGTEPDYGRYGGALAVFDVATDQLAVYRHIVPDQSISAVTARGDIAYIGSDIRSGLGTVPTASRAELAAVDVTTGAVRWMVEAPAEATVVTDLVFVDDELVGITATGLLFGVDFATGHIRWQQQVGTSAGPLVRTRTGMYTTDGDTLYRIWWASDATQPPQVETVMSGMAGEWYGPPAVTASPDGTSLYTVAGRSLVRLTVPGELFAAVDADAESESVGDPSRSRVWRALVTVTISDHQGRPLPDATVIGTWQPVGRLPEQSAECTTDDAGQCVLSRRIVDAEATTVSVTGVEHPDLPGGQVEVQEIVPVAGP